MSSAAIMSCFLKMRGPATSLRAFIFIACLWVYAARCAAGDWVYFGTYTTGDSRGIYTARMGADGLLEAPRLAAPARNPAFLATDSRHRFLYAICEITNAAGKRRGGLRAYAIDPQSGNLSSLNERIAGDDVLCHVSVDASNRVVLAASYAGGSVASFPIQPDGSLGERASYVKHTGSSVNPANQKSPHAHCVVADPENRRALVCDLGIDKIIGYGLDAATGRLSTNGQTGTAAAPGAGPRHLAFHPNGRFAYVVNEMGCDIIAMTYDPVRGSLAQIQTLSALPDGREPGRGLSGAEIAVHPSGKFLYCSTRGIDQVNVFAVNPSNGTLTPIEHVSSGGHIPRSFAIDPSGRYLVAANQNSNDVVSFRIDPDTGKLTPLGKVPLASPSCVLFVSQK
jgi:6-phosphogluconolactonase